MPAPSRPRLFWSLGGVGLGNATRTEAMLGALDGRAEVSLQGFGAALPHLRGVGRQVAPLVPMRLGSGAVQTLALAPLNLLGWVVNVVLSTVRILRSRPDVVVVDSEYSAILPALLTGCRLVAVNQAPVVVRCWPDLGSPEHAWSYRSREIPDAALCRLAHRVIVPTVAEVPSLPARHTPVPPIVRPLPAPASRRAGWLVMRGGSRHTRALTLPDGVEAQDVGAERCVPDTLTRLASAELVVCHGGLSSLSEVRALGCRAVVVPLQDHAEQAIHARLLARSGHVVLAEDGDVGAAVDAALALPGEALSDPGAGARTAAGVLMEEARRARAPASRQASIGSGLLAASFLAVLAAIGTDLGMLAQDLVKLETANALQLRAHALIRDGLVVVATAPDAYHEASTHWVFHPLLALTPRLDHVAAVLNTTYFAAAAGLGVGIGRRLGWPIGLLSAAVLLASPVRPILSKHVISTALMPGVAAWWVVSVMDLARRGRDGAAASSLLSTLALYTLNVGHLPLALPVGWAWWRGRPSALPRWFAPLAATVLLPWFARRWWASQQGLGWLEATWWPPNPPYADLWAVWRRFVLVEPGMHEVFPHLWVLLALPVAGAVVSWTDRDDLPTGLVVMLATAPLLALSNLEASVVWMVPTSVWFAWLATRRRWLGAAVGLHLVLTPASFGTAVLGGGLPEDDFFALSMLRARERMLAVLTDDFGMTADEFETLALHHPEGEPGTANAITPGLDYLVDRVHPPLAAGGSRCLSVSDPDHPAPVDPEVELVDGPLVYRVWRDASGCDGSPRQRASTLLALDLSTGALVEVRP